MFNSKFTPKNRPSLPQKEAKGSSVATATKQTPKADMNHEILIGSGSGILIVVYEIVPYIMPYITG